jgi:hypothetical protein
MSSELPSVNYASALYCVVAPGAIEEGPSTRNSLKSLGAETLEAPGGAGDVGASAQAAAISSSAPTIVLMAVGAMGSSSGDE